jgi:hypothetical protein
MESVELRIYQMKEPRQRRLAYTEETIDLILEAREFFDNP